MLSQIELVNSIASQAPGTAAIIIVVMLFLKSQTRRDDLIRQLSTEATEARSHSRRVIEAATKTIGQSIELE